MFSQMSPRFGESTQPNEKHRSFGGLQATMDKYPRFGRFGESRSSAELFSKPQELVYDEILPPPNSSTHATVFCLEDARAPNEFPFVLFVARRSEVEAEGFW